MLQPCEGNKRRENKENQKQRDDKSRFELLAPSTV